MNILIVDDSKINRKLLRVTLQAEGLQTWEAADGVEALAVLSRAEIDVIISDILMPNMDGYRLCYEVRKSPRWKTLPFIAYTGTYTSSGDEKLAFAFGADKYLKKPAPVETILEAFREVTAGVKRPTPRSLPPPEELEIMKTYSEQLVKKLEERNSELVEQSNALQKSEEKFRKIFENILDVFYRIDMRGILQMVSPSIERYGYRADELIGSPLGSLCADPADLERLIKDVAERKFIRYLEVALKRKDGTALPVSMSARLLIDSQGPPTGMEGILRDITALKQVEQERARLLVREQAARKQAEEANRLKDEFLAMVSHELRTPLMAILGWGRMLQDGGLEETMVAQAVEMIVRNAKSQAKIVEDLLDASRMVTGTFSFDVHPIELAPVVEAVIDMLRPAAEAKAIPIEFVRDRRASWVAGDSNRLQQIVSNLLSNAIKFTPKEGHIQVRLEGGQGQARITVCDTGRGIRAEFLPHVFDRFRQSDSSITRKHGGLGLGLAIVHHLVELHNGTVHAASPGEGQGATFTVSLPLMAHHHAVIMREVFTGSEILKGSNQSQGLDGLRVLVVDDEMDARALITCLLELNQAEVKAVASAAEARETLPWWQPHVLVCDIGMPGEDGYTLIRKVRALDPEHGGGVPAVALTAYARTEDRQQALSAGYQMHISKPVEPNKLVEVVASLAGRTKAEEVVVP